MKTVDKAFSVLDQFSLENTEIGLSELSRMAALLAWHILHFPVPKPQMKSWR